MTDEEEEIEYSSFNEYRQYVSDCVQNDIEPLLFSEWIKIKLERAVNQYDNK